MNEKHGPKKIAKPRRSEPLRASKTCHDHDSPLLVREVHPPVHTDHPALPNDKLGPLSPRSRRRRARRRGGRRRQARPGRRRRRRHKDRWRTGPRRRRGRLLRCAICGGFSHPLHDALLAPAKEDLAQPPARGWRGRRGGGRGRGSSRGRCAAGRPVVDPPLHASLAAYEDDFFHLRQRRVAGGGGSQGAHLRVVAFVLDPRLFRLWGGGGFGVRHVPVLPLDQWVCHLCEAGRRRRDVRHGDVSFLGLDPLAGRLDDPLRFLAGASPLEMRRGVLVFSCGMVSLDSSYMRGGIAWGGQNMMTSEAAELAYNPETRGAFCQRWSNSTARETDQPDSGPRSVSWGCPLNTVSRPSSLSTGIG